MAGSITVKENGEWLTRSIKLSCNLKRVVSFFITFNLLVFSSSVGLDGKARGFFLSKVFHV